MIGQLSRVAIVMLAAVVPVGCANTTDGKPGGTATGVSTTAPSSSAPSSTTPTSEPSGSAVSTTPSMPDYGVVETTKRPVSAGEVTCRPDPAPADPVDVTGTAPGSPTVMIAIPDGFTPTGQADTPGLSLSGPESMTATVTIVPTTLDPAAAFRQHADELTGHANISSISLLPGDLCGYSGQEMMGSAADSPGAGTDFADRVVHVWTGAGDFLVTVHLQAPNGATGFDNVRSALFSDFGIRMP